jgi:hypothetical protein
MMTMEPGCLVLHLQVTRALVQIGLGTSGLELEHLPPERHVALRHQQHDAAV